MLMFQSMAAAILILSLINIAHAHCVWLEWDGEGSAYAYFGEWVDDIREKAGGLLDRIKAPRAFLGASTTPLRRTPRQNGSYRDWAAEMGKAFNDR